MPHRSFVCNFCGIKFERYVPPSDPRGTRKFCSRSCQMKHTRYTRGAQPATIQKYTCKQCGIEFERLTKASRRYPIEFCSRRCANFFNAQDNRSYEKIFERWEKKHGSFKAQEMLDEFRLKKSAAFSGEKNPNFGKRLSEQTKNKISRSCTGIPNALKGKTFEEYYGVERAQELAQRHSRRLREGFATGRLSPTVRTPQAPTYKGVKLRSKLELSAIHYLEREIGATFGLDLLYEDKNTRVTWIDSFGKQHTYTPDLYDSRTNTIYEVKPAWRVSNESDEMKRKRKAVENVRSFCYLTDERIFRCLSTTLQLH